MDSRELIVIQPPAAACGVESCESCGAGFECGASASACWCAEVKLDEAVRAGLRERFRRCLCRACLEAYAARDGGGPADV